MTDATTGTGRPAGHPVPVDTVTGPVPSDRLGLVLTHEHLANDLRAPGAVPDPADPGLFDAAVTPALQPRLRDRPYACRDNMALDDDEAMADELRAYRAAGGGTVVDATPAGLGRSPARVRRLALASGVQVVMGSGWYLEAHHPALLAGASVDRWVDALLLQFRPATAEDGVIPGVIGEIGVSAAFTVAEQRVLRAAGVVQREVGKPLLVHLPGWQRRGHEVLDILLDQGGVDPAAVVLCHLDPSGSDPGYQRSLADRGVWCGFDMIGMPYTFPGEGAAPSASATATALARLIDAGHGHRLLLSHDLFLKSMLSSRGGPGLTYLLDGFPAVLERAGVAGGTVGELLSLNPRALFEAAAHR